MTRNQTNRMINLSFVLLFMFFMSFTLQAEAQKFTTTTNIDAEPIDDSLNKKRPNESPVVFSYSIPALAFDTLDEDLSRNVDKHRNGQIWWNRQNWQLYREVKTFTHSIRYTDDIDLYSVEFSYEDNTEHCKFQFKVLKKHFKTASDIPPTTLFDSDWTTDFTNEILYLVGNADKDIADGDMLWIEAKMDTQTDNPVDPYDPDFDPYDPQETDCAFLGAKVSGEK